MTLLSTVLVVDDHDVGRAALEEALEGQGYHVAGAASGAEALELAAQLLPDVILLDVMLPELDGFEVCRRLRSDPDLAEVPVVMVTALDDSASRVRGLEAGADDFITKPFNRLELRARVRTITRLNRYRRLRDEHAQLQAAHLELRQTYDATIEGWVRALDLRDKETEHHTQRITELTLRLAQSIGITGEARAHLRRGALLHDIGKLGVPDAILLKPGRLTPAEWAIMRLHPVYAYDWLAPIDYLRPALDIPRYHHERWDGTGYPYGLKGPEIPLAARIFAVVDVWDALRSDRPYRAGWPAARVCTHLREQAGTHFDPQVVEVFLNVVAKDDCA